MTFSVEAHVEGYFKGLNCVGPHWHSRVTKKRENIEKIEIFSYEYFF